MSCHQHLSFLQHKSSSSSATTPFSGNQSGLTSGNSSNQSNIAGVSCSAQAPGNRISLADLTLSGDGAPYGTVSDFCSVSIPSSASIQHSTPQHCLQQSTCYNQSGRERTTLQYGATSRVAPESVSLQTHSSDFGYAPQRQRFCRNDPQDFSSAATDTGLSFSGWDHSTFYSRNEQHRCCSNSHNDATSRQLDMRYSTPWCSPGPLPGQRSCETTLCQPGSSLMGVDFSDTIQDQPDVPMGTPFDAGQTKAGKTNFESIGFHCQGTNDTNSSPQFSSIYRSPPLFQHHMNESNGAPEYIRGQNVPCWNKTVPTTIGSMEAHPVNCQHQQSLNITSTTEGLVNDEIRRPTTSATSMQAQGTSTAASLKPPLDVQVHDPFPELECDSDELEVWEETFLTRRDISQEFSTLLSQLNDRDGRRLYACKLCQYVCYNINRMKIHLRIHTGEKPYTCLYCGKDFSQSPNLKAHERIHTGLKPYTCRYCPKAFRYSQDRKNHEWTHTDKGPILEQFLKSLQSA